jgi:hypothetical protein
MSSPKKRYKHTTAKQEGGDDGYCYVIRDKHTGREIINGLTRHELSYYRNKYEKEQEAKRGQGLSLSKKGD